MAVARPAWTVGCNPRRGRATGSSGPTGRPARTAPTRAASATVRAITPTVSRLSANTLMPARVTRPKLGLKPTTPQNAAGRMTEPPVWVPSATGTMPSATAAAEPLDEPPGVRAGSWGLVVRPASQPANSVVTVLPRMIAPAAGTSPAAIRVTLRSSAGQASSTRGNPSADGAVVITWHRQHGTGAMSFRRTRRPARLAR